MSLLLSDENQGMEETKGGEKVVQVMRNWEGTGKPGVGRRWSSLKASEEDLLTGLQRKT